ncbi:MAG TPA: 4a-hydroxytetrahydrobiopterin dehydratase [Candidatus Sulfotelmatobacter sp.]|nr:4a-hydroxytetrahydrobiopterin dehydratase [Candidatus Sulfotelmatobacter sp.]
MEWPAVYERLQRLKPGWHVSSQGHLERAVRFEDFAKALEFANHVGALAEAMGHHPDLHISWGLCTIEIWTHDVEGLTEKDFTLAAKVDDLR